MLLPETCCHELQVNSYFQTLKYQRVLDRFLLSATFGQLSVCTGEDPDREGGTVDWTSIINQSPEMKTSTGALFASVNLLEPTHQIGLMREEAEQPPDLDTHVIGFNAQHICVSLCVYTRTFYFKCAAGLIPTILNHKGAGLRNKSPHTSPQQERLDLSKRILWTWNSSAGVQFTRKLQLSV